MFLSLIGLSFFFQLPLGIDLERGPSSSELSFRFSSGHLIQVDGRIGTQGNLKFILDTGATISIVDQKVADKLKLDHHPAESFNFDRRLNWESAIVPEIQFGPIKAAHVVMFVGKLAEYSDFAKNADAVIGLDLLKLSNFSIELATKKIIFTGTTPKAHESAVDRFSDCLILEVRVQGHPVQLIVDTGVPDMLLYEERLHKRVPSLRMGSNVTDVIMGGRLKAKQTVVSGVSFGKGTRDITVLLLPSPSPEVLPGIEGVIGIAPLKARRVNFDFVGRTFSFE